MALDTLDHASRRGGDCRFSDKHGAGSRPALFIVATQSRDPHSSPRADLFGHPSGVKDRPVDIDSYEFLWGREGAGNGGRKCLCGMEAIVRSDL